MNDEENIWYQKQIAIEGIKSGVLTALGIGLLAIGASFGIAGNTIPTNLFEIQSGILLIGGGTAIVLMGVEKSTRKIKALTYTPTNHLESNIVPHPPNSDTNEEKYTGNRYFHTRPRLAYHPRDKQFRD